MASTFASIPIMSPLAAPLAPGQHSTFGIQNSVLVMAGAAAVFCVLLEHTRTGRNHLCDGRQPRSLQARQYRCPSLCAPGAGHPGCVYRAGCHRRNPGGRAVTGVISNGLSIMGGEAFWQYIVQRGVPGRGDVRSGDGDDAEMEGDTTQSTQVKPERS